MSQYSNTNKDYGNYDGKYYNKNKKNRNQTIYTEQTKEYCFNIQQQNKYKTPTKEQLEKYNIRKHYDINRWNPELEPIIFCASVFSFSTIGDYIYLWVFTKKDIDSIELKVSERLMNSLRSLEDRILSANETLKYNLNYEEREIITDFMSASSRIKNRLQNILNNCNTAMDMTDRYYTINQETIVSILLKTIFDEYTHIYTLAEIINSINIWTKRFQANVNVIVIKYLGEY